jgi:hypothetical protein
MDPFSSTWKKAAHLLIIWAFFLFWCVIFVNLQNQLLLEEIEDLQRKEHELQQANAELLQKVKILYLLPQPTVQFQLLLSLFGGLWTASLLKIKVAVSFFSKYIFHLRNMQNPF